MKNSLQVRRQAVLRELDRINRQIVQTEKNIAQIRNQIAVLQQPHAKAA